MNPKFLASGRGIMAIPGSGHDRLRGAEVNQFRIADHRADSVRQGHPQA